MNASDLLAELAQRASIAGLEFNAAGRARIQVDSELLIDLEQDAASGQLHVYAVIGHPPAEEREPFFARLLAMNLFCRRTLGATLALDPVSGELLLCRVLDLAITDYRTFEGALENLANAAVGLRGELASAPRDEAVEEESFARAALETGAWVRA